MKRLFHICMKSSSEVLFRDEEDYLRGINCLAMACIETGNRVGTFSFQSDHVHFDLFTENHYPLVLRWRISYTKYFNKKYERKGPLLDDYTFVLELVGARHIESAESYILRNSVHHGITSIPFGYPFNSTACYFSSDFSRQYLDSIDFAKYRKFNFLPVNRRPPKDTLLNAQGMIKAECFMEISMVEKFFGSARAFCYCMTRLSGEEWERTQQKDGNNLPPITLHSIEQPFSIDIEQMLKNEKGHLAGTRLTDMQLCSMIDKNICPKLGVRTYAHLDHEQKLLIFHRLTQRRDCPYKEQIMRCLALNDYNR